MSHGFAAQVTQKSDTHRSFLDKNKKISYYFNGRHTYPKKFPSPRLRGGGHSLKGAATYSPALRAVPSARAGLTSLFGMGRGGTHRRHSHHNTVDMKKGQAWTPVQERFGESPGGTAACRRPASWPHVWRPGSFRAISSARL